MDVALALASRRDVREFAARPLAPDLQARILDAGRMSGSARNRQPWIFCVLESERARSAVAGAVYRASLVTGAPLVVAMAATPGGRLVDFDVGRAAQSMMLAAWAEGVGSCPSGIADTDRLATAIGLRSPEYPVIVVSFGYPARPRDPARRTPAVWSARARRRPLAEIVRRI